LKENIQKKWLKKRNKIKLKILKVYILQKMRIEPKNKINYIDIKQSHRRMKTKPQHKLLSRYQNHLRVKISESGMNNFH